MIKEDEKRGILNRKRQTKQGKEEKSKREILKEMRESVEQRNK